MHGDEHGARRIAQRLLASAGSVATGQVTLVGAGPGQAKVFELFDRQALAGLGHPADLERLRQAGYLKIGLVAALAP